MPTISQIHDLSMGCVKGVLIVSYEVVGDRDRGYQVRWDCARVRRVPSCWEDDRTLGVTKTI